MTDKTASASKKRASVLDEMTGDDVRRLQHMPVSSVIGDFYPIFTSTKGQYMAARQREEATRIGRDGIDPLESLD